MQILDHYFGNVCELDLVFGFHKVYCILDEFIIGGEIQETSKKVPLLERGVVQWEWIRWRCITAAVYIESVEQLFRRPTRLHLFSLRPRALRPPTREHIHPVFIQQVILERLKELDSLET